MNTNATTTTYQDIQQERFARRVASHLSASTIDLPHDITERLRASRVQALAKRKMVPSHQTRTASAIVVNGGGSATLSHGGMGSDLGLWGRVASVLPLIVLIAGLITISTLSDHHRAHDVADVDAALLTDTLPPSAYTDPGFAQFLKVTAQQGQ